MTFSKVLLFASALSTATAWHEGTSSADLRRAFKKRPHKDSHVAGETGDAAFKAMNRHLEASGAPTKPCEEWHHDELNNLVRELHDERDPALHTIYKNRNDKRALHFDNLDYKEELWLEEKASQLTHSSDYNTTRDGKCAELVMWWAHHIPQKARVKLSAKPQFRVPQMPAAGPAMSHVGDTKVKKEYIYQIQCISCHLVMPCKLYATNQTKGSSLEMLCPKENATETPLDEPEFNPHGQPQTCPNNPETGKPWVFYNRTKRCEWDFDPPCGMCEGIGGPIWGNDEDEWRPARCKPLMKPEEIPKDNITNPVWPKAFTTNEYSCGNTNALDACSPKGYACKDGAHGGWTLAYRQRDMSEYPVPASGWPLKGLQPEQRQDIPSAGSPLGLGHSSQWTLPNGNMFTQSHMVGINSCICFSDPNKQPRPDNSTDPRPGGKYSPGTPDPFKKFDNVLLGPLRWDFPHDAVLVGREEIEMEWTEFGKQDSHRMVIADHWNKGPHHFWYEVSTNLMVRQYQTEAALTVQTNWTVGEPDPSLFVIPEVCYKGLMHFNLSCVSPPPSPSPSSVSLI